MSIPKEPRQLMINLMYLVLTALLALNVSAEVMNAFFDIDKSLSKSASLAAGNADDTKKGIEGAFEGPKAPLKPILYGAMDATKENVDGFVEYVESIKTQLIDGSGNKNGVIDEGDMGKYGKPKGKKNKDITTRLLVEGGVGEELRDNIVKLRSQIISEYTKAVSNETVIDVAKLNTKDKEEVNKKIAAFDHAVELKPKSVEEIKATTDKSTWSEYKFKQMPIAAILPVLTKFQTDARNAQALAANEFAQLVGGREVVLDKFFPIMNAKRGYVIKGEKFEAEVAIGAFSNEFAKTSSITVNGTRINLNDEGKGTYTETANKYGKKTLNLKARVENPLTGEVIEGSSSFDYEVGERSASMFLTKMNVFYIGVNNPFEVSVAGASSNEVNVSATGAGAKISGSGGDYSATVSTPGDVKVNVTAPGLQKAFNIRAKRIPDPVATLGGTNKGGKIGNGTFKAQRGLIAVLESFDFDARCDIQGFEFVRVPQRQDPIVKP
ncbi:MAG TPA: GldM family protein, partial [Saprospiraceae bacterium]|nr:GldM family protein [Saprospiraceae bacterium]